MRKVRSEQYELLDLNEYDQIAEDLDWKGDDGLSTNWSMYYKYPQKEFLDAYLEDLELAMNDIETHDITIPQQSTKKKQLRMCRRGQNLSGKLC